MNQHDQEFELRARQALDSSVTALDGETRRRLAAGRARALERKSFLARWLPAGNWVPAATFAAIAVVAVTLFVVNRQPDLSVQVAQSDSEFALEVLLADESPDSEADPDFFIVMDAMMDEEDAQHAG